MRLPMAGVGTFETSTDVRFPPLLGQMRTSSSGCRTIVIYEYTALMQMPQLVGISHHIDCGDLSVLDFERGRLKFAVGLQRDETGQSVDEAGTHEFRAILPGNDRQIFRGPS